MLQTSGRQAERDLWILPFSALNPLSAAKNMLLPTVLPLLFCFGVARGFRPNHESGGIAPTDFTDADITEKAVLQAVAWFMEKNPLPGRPLMDPGALDDKTATEIFKAYFQADVSPNRLMKAIQEIVDGNNEVEMHHGEDSSFFFSCEEIAKSIKQLRVLQKSMFSSLEKNPLTTADLESARLSAGKALHVLQKFYSNTNWVEMGNDEPYHFLINEDSSSAPVTPPSEQTCRDCIKEINGKYSCKNNLVTVKEITSGYKLSATCKGKPQGKCGHGGKDDVTQDDFPTGGINKETSNPLLSPHSDLHSRAAQLAIEATKNFFVEDDASLYTQVGENIFRKFFNLQGFSLAFVIDTTSSMTSEIAEVKAACVEILQNYSKSPDAPYNYILVPFNDPDVGPVFKTNNVNMFESQIANLTVVGGGDCPEMSLSGLKLALQESLPSSKIFTFTDDFAKDAHLKEDIEILIEKTESEVNYFLTENHCRSSRSTDRRTRVRERSYDNLYEELAAFSGGSYVKTKKSDLSQVLRIMELSLNAAPVKVALARLDGTQFPFPVDETLTEITVSVKSISFSSGFSMTVQQPSGAPLASTHMVINTDTHKVVKVSPIKERGSWTVTVSRRGIFEVEIGGKSLLDFSYQIMEKQKEYVLPIQGRPVTGMSYTVSMKLLGDSKGGQVQRLVPISDLGIPIGSVSINQTSDALGNTLAIASLSVDTPSFLLSVEGLSPGGLPFSRLSASPIRAESVQIVLLPGQNLTVSAGRTLEISVKVVNAGQPGMFNFKVWDDLNFLKSFSPNNKFLNSGKDVTLTATFLAAIDNSMYNSSTATFLATSVRAQNYLKLPITVIPETALEIDKIPPVHKLLKFNMPCAAISQTSPDCSHHIWRMTFSAKGDHSAVNVQVASNPSGLACYPGEAGDAKDIVCDYKSNCCSPSAEVLINDGDGNMDTFTVDYKTPHLTAA
ncbi:von Willebrand factor A domain-containing protein 7-like [Elgaria multicarinata webbii]|uniref:von Willebrand factor A domain-containing protein 7-like n=1 Tax=Elgaria multicarinata webbii TaxID=159646 RepID=UPI002FCD1C69